MAEPADERAENADAPAEASDPLGWVRPWRRVVTDALFAVTPNHHVDSYNQFLHVTVPRLQRTYGTLSTVFAEESPDGTVARFHHLVTPENVRCVWQHVSVERAQAQHLNLAVDVVVDLRYRVYRLAPDPPPSGVSEDLQPPDALEHDRIEVPDHTYCSIPAMLDSDACSRSLWGHIGQASEPVVGGTFLIRGKFRMIPFLERLAYNEPFLFEHMGRFACQVRSEHLDEPERSTSTLNLMLTPGPRDSVPEGSTLEGVQRKVGEAVGLGRQLLVHIPFLKPLVPLHVLVVALGSNVHAFINEVLRADVNPQELRTLAHDHFMRLRATHCHSTQTDQALATLAVYYKRQTSDVPVMRASVLKTLHNEILPHLNGTHAEAHPDVQREKIRYLALMTALVIRYSLGKLPMTDRDAYMVLAVDGPGELLGQLLRARMRSCRELNTKTLRKMLHAPEDRHKPWSERVNLRRIFDDRRLTQQLFSAMGSGKWSKNREGLTQPLCTTNPMAAAAQMRRVSRSAFSAKNVGKKPRMKDTTGLGFICTAETPDGEPCGLVGTLACTCVISGSVDVTAVWYVATRLAWTADLWVPWDPATWPQPGWYKVLDPHGRWRGWVRDGPLAAERLRALRRQLRLDAHVSVAVSHDRQWLYVRCTAGRLLRPLLRLARLDALPPLVQAHVRQANEAQLMDALLRQGVLEYVDTAEVDGLSIAIQPHLYAPDTHTHLEVHDLFVFGLNALSIVFAAHNQGPRNTYHTSMSKQYIVGDAPFDPGATKTYQLDYGQRPLVGTRNDFTSQAAGHNAVVALILGSEAQEDAIMIKKGFVDRGGFRGSLTRMFAMGLAHRAGQASTDLFEKPAPDRTVALKLASRDRIEDDGLPLPGTQMQYNDVLIGKTTLRTRVSAQRAKVPDAQRALAFDRVDASLTLHREEAGTVDAVMRTDDTAKVWVRAPLRVEPGNKLSSRHGQKGVESREVPDEDMPFSETTGLIPDMIVSPHALPSRMTVGKLIEILCAKAVAVSGDVSLGVDEQELHVPLHEAHLARVRATLRKYGFASHGCESLRDGATGELLQAQIFMGPCYYGMQTHLVSNKMHMRTTGPRQAMLLQPREGRKQQGGIRVGHMEFDNLATHGAAAQFRERYNELSDKVITYWCQKCRQLADANPRTGLYFCRRCATGAYVVQVPQSQTTCVIMQELACNGVAVRYDLHVPDPADSLLPIVPEC